MSNSYIFCEEAPARMRATLRPASLLTCLRNPFDRAFSNDLFWLRNAQAAGSFEDVLAARRNDLLDHGRYAHHLGRYLMHFPRDQLLVLAFDDLQRDPSARSRVARVHRVVASHVPEVAADKLLGRPDRAAASPPGWSRERDAVRWAGLPCRRRHQVKGGALPRALYREVRCGRVPSMRPETGAELSRYSAADVTRLSELTRRDCAALWFGDPGQPRSIT